MDTQHQAFTRPIPARLPWAGALCLSAVLFAACGGSETSGHGHFGGGGNGAGGSQGGGGQSGSTTTLTLTIPDNDGGSVVPTGDGGITDPTECAKSTQKVELLPLDLGLLVDTSTSMDYDNKWLKISGAIGIVSESQAYVNIGMALQYFPLRLACDEVAYQTPDVAMGTLPGVGAALRASLAQKQMYGGTPLVQAMRGMGKYLTDWATANPTHKTVLVIATDGMPDSTCAGSTHPNSLTEAVATAKGLSEGTLYTGAPKLLVFVIGVGAQLTALNDIAAAGGSGQATLVSSGADVDKQFIAALDAIRKQTMTCDYPIPAPPQGGQLDLSAVNVSFSDGTTKETLGYVPDEASCSLSASAGWHFDSTTAPSKVVLCPDTCTRVMATANGGVNVIFGCARNDVPL